MKNTRYSLIVSYGDDINDAVVLEQSNLLTNLFSYGSEVQFLDLGWHDLSFRVRNKMKKWVKRAKFLKFNFQDSGVFVQTLPFKLRNLEIEPLRFTLLKISNQEEDLNKILI